MVEGPVGPVGALTRHKKQAALTHRAKGEGGLVGALASLRALLSAFVAFREVVLRVLLLPVRKPLALVVRAVTQVGWGVLLTWGLCVAGGALFLMGRVLMRRQYCVHNVIYERDQNSPLSLLGWRGWRVKYSLIPSNIPGVHPGVVSRKRFFIATEC